MTGKTSAINVYGIWNGNPIFRVVAKVLFSPTDSMDRYLHDLSGIESLGGRR